jgi:hypothetical protein
MVKSIFIIDHIQNRQQGGSGAGYTRVDLALMNPDRPAVRDGALFSQKVPMPASYHMAVAGTPITIHVPGYRIAHLAPVQILVKLADTIALFNPDKKSIIIVYYFEKNEPISSISGKSSAAGQNWLNAVVQVIISV